MTGWIGQAWEELSENKDMIIQSFKKCVAADGSEDEDIHIEGLEEYNYSSDSDVDYTVCESGEESARTDPDEDPFASDEEHITTLHKL